MDPAAGRARRAINAGLLVLAAGAAGAALRGRLVQVDETGEPPPTAEVRSPEETSATDLSKKEEMATEARIEWALHLHREVHNYVRSSITMMQFLGAIVAAAIAVVFRYPDARVPCLIAAPYILGIAIILWTEYNREIAVCATVIRHLEQRLEHELGDPALIHERALASSGVGRLTALSNNLLMALVFVATVYFSAVAGDELPGRWGQVHDACLLLVGFGIALTTVDLLRAPKNLARSALLIDPIASGPVASSDASQDG